MSGRLKRWALAGLLAGAVGCKSSPPVQMAEPTLPVPQNKSSMVSRMFGGGNQFVPQAPPTEHVAARPSRKGEKPTPDYEVASAAMAVEAAFMEGRSAVERDQALDAARQSYQRALAADPKFKPALAGIARMYAMSGDKDHAVAAYRTALQHHPKDHELAHAMARSCASLEDWHAGAEAARYALSLDPENRTYVKTLGLCQVRLGQVQEGGETLMRVMPEAHARYLLGRALIDMNRIDEGKHQIAAAAAQDPQYTTAKQFLTDWDAGMYTQGPVVNVGAQEPARTER